MSVGRDAVPTASKAHDPRNEPGWIGDAVGIAAPRFFDVVLVHPCARKVADPSSIIVDGALLRVHFSPWMTFAPIRMFRLIPC